MINEVNLVVVVTLRVVRCVIVFLGIELSLVGRQCAYISIIFNFKAAAATTTTTTNGSAD